ncbi:AT-hook motif nuclear-localized protein 6 [Lactuca sativa]|uniref:AT-hook motif nuclear-localized protein n=1 Tax=Lactuca sativa TaxID=4236 RepID=A0A9R1WVQ4_LACSA|nr:AT-hook motif nuclear-localized protein 6 [Lactuca sativa]KAJ0188319.1 hypothetical protein LSAT_V11C900478080 [Lactuca sativa]
MEGTEENHNSGSVVVFGGEGTLSGSTVAPPPPPPPPPPAAESLVGAVIAVNATPGSDGFKKKRGRPRKYGPDGKPKVTLSPMPISSSIPLSGDFPGWKQKQEKPITSIKRKQKLEFRPPGAQLASSIGADFTPHVLTVNSGEDVNMKIISFAQQGTKAICVLAANGAVSNVTLGQPNASGGTLTYEGRFDILCLSGAFTPNENGGAKGWSGGMSVSLAGPDGRVLGGGLAGMLVAAGSVQVILGSFLTDLQQEQQKSKKSRFEPFATTPFFKETYGDHEPNISFTLTNPRSLDTERNGSLHVSESNTSQFEVSC